MKGSLNSLRPARTLMLLAGALFVLGIHGQDAAGFSYLIHFSQELQHRQEKYLQEGLVSQDPMMKMRVQSSAMSAFVRTGVPVDLDALQAYVAPSDLVLVGLGPLVLRDASGGSGDVKIPAQPPVYIDTGDPSADQARYAADKIAWALAHPVEEVQDQIDPTPED